MIRGMVALALGVLVGGYASAQDVVGDVLAGNLVKPKAGVWSWYDIADTASDSTLMLRLAIVGEEKVKGKTGYWLEIEVVPTMGYKSVYKMLVTGPANDPKNVHKMFLREGTEPAKEVPVAPESAAPAPPEGSKKLVGEEEIEAAGGKLRAKHYEIAQADKQIEVWTSENISPMGIVQMKSATSTMRLRASGEGGQEAQSALEQDTPKAPNSAEAVKVQVQVDKTPDVKKTKKGETKK